MRPGSISFVIAVWRKLIVMIEKNRGKKHMSTEKVQGIYPYHDVAVLNSEFGN